MNIHSLVPIIAAGIYLIVGIFVYSKRQSNPVNKSFAAMLICISLWFVERGGVIGAPSAEFADYWGKVFRNGLLFIPPTLLYFALIFSSGQAISKGAEKVLFASFALSCFFGVINWTPYLTAGAKKFPYGYHSQSGPLYIFFIIYFVLCILFSFYFLIRGAFQADGYRRQRVKYFLLSIVVSFVLGSFGFLPLYGVDVFPFAGVAGVTLSSVVVTLGLFMAVYTVVQHRLMDVSVFMAKGSGYILSAVILGVPSILAIIFLENYFFHGQNTSFTIFALLIGSITAALFGQVYSRVQRAMQQVIVRDKYWYQEVLEEFSRRLVTIVDLNRLLYMLADTIQTSMGVRNISIFLFDEERKIFHPVLNRGPNGAEIAGIFYEPAAPSIRFLHENKEALLRVELERTPEGPGKAELLKMMVRFEFEACLPLVYAGRFIGFIALGHKKEEEMYYREDLDLLNLLANQMAIAIENANLYESLKKSQVIMRRADRLASLGTLVASLAHEIRNPLVSIRTFTQLLPERIDDEEFRNYFLKVATGEIDRLSSLISELLGFARPSEPRLQGEDINALIDKMELLIANEARKKEIEITNNFSSTLPPVMIDAEQIKQVLLNVFLNAIQAISGEGRIWVETRLVQVTRDGNAENLAQIEIRDTGIGIPKENIDHVFDPFFSTRPEGSGLGLAISHQIISEHGGFIDLESEVGKGTSFRIHLPIKIGGEHSPNQPNG